MISHLMVYYVFDTIYFLQWPQKYPVSIRIRIWILINWPLRSRSGSVIQDCLSVDPDPDPKEILTDPEHFFPGTFFSSSIFTMTD